MSRRLLQVGRSLLLILVFASPLLAGYPNPAPELDPGSIASAMTLLIGGLMILKDRKRSK